MGEGTVAEAPLQRHGEEPEQPANFRRGQVHVRQQAGDGRQRPTHPVRPVAEQGGPTQVEDGGEGEVSAEGQLAFPAPRNRNTRTEITTAASIPAKMYSSVSPVLLLA